jgi:homopolymeric O-antigen transport system ATP-binding protein
MAPVIRVEAVGKRYWLDSPQGHQNLSQLLEGAVRAPLRRLLGESTPAHPNEEFWALHDISFEVDRGEIFGLIGANGSGKSTLLRLLAHITLPTEGRITILGSVGTLLEVGTGFHPELTGRENVYLNGAILGMRRREIDAKFDQIVEFSGVEQFLDVPVKRYSSGMHVRLAFAVAAHLEPEILLVDEVLSVGDAEFQRKCVDKMDEVARGGRTIVFVSHSMETVENLCGRCAWINHGGLAEIGTTSAVTASYLKHVEQHIESRQPEAVGTDSNAQSVGTQT